MQGQAVARLYRRHASAIEAHCHRLLGRSADASDAVHETFIRVLARGGAHDSDEHALRSLFRISTHVCIDLLRQRRVRARALPELMVHAQQRQVQPDGYEAREQVLELLGQCDDLARAILLLHGLHGLRRTDVAAELGTTRKTVFNRWKRIEQLALQL